MEPLRRARRLASLMLACFALALGTAIVAPMFSAYGTQLEFASICTTNGNFVPPLPSGDDDPASGHKHHSLDCPLCLLGDAAPSFDWPSLSEPQPLARAAQPIEAARLAAMTAAPLPARGPPARA